MQLKHVGHCLRMEPQAITDTIRIVDVLSNTTCTYHFQIYIVNVLKYSGRQGMEEKKESSHIENSQNIQHSKKQLLDKVNQERCGHEHFKDVSQRKQDSIQSNDFSKFKVVNGIYAWNYTHCATQKCENKFENMKTACDGCVKSGSFCPYHCQKCLVDIQNQQLCESCETALSFDIWES